MTVSPNLGIPSLLVVLCVGVMSHGLSCVFVLRMSVVVLFRLYLDNHVGETLWTYSLLLLEDIIPQQAL